MVKGTLFRIDADIENERGDVMLRQRGFATCPQYGFDDYYTFIWPGASAAYNLDLIMSLYRDCGIDGCLCMSLGTMTGGMPVRQTT